MYRQDKSKQGVHEMPTSEAKQENPSKQLVNNLTDLSSFTAFGVVTLSDGQRVNVQMTNRHGLPAEKMYEDYKDYVKFLDLCAQDHNVEYWDGNRSNGDSKTPAAKNNGSTPEKKARRWDEPVPNAELPAELAEVTVDVFTQEFDVIKVLPQPDDKANVEFWKDNLKFPVGAKLNKAKYETIKGYFSHLELENMIDPAKAGEYRIAGIQYWTQGNEYEYNGEKKHYKNIVLLKPAL